jgi:hypothetical protein
VLLGNASNVPTATAITGDVTVTSGGVTAIGSGVIVDADINASAEIAVSKLADGSARQLLQTDAAGTGVEWTSNVDVPGTLDVTGAAALDSTLTVAGAATFNGSVTMGDADDIILATTPAPRSARRSGKSWLSTTPRPLFSQPQRPKRRRQRRRRTP